MDEEFFVDHATSECFLLLEYLEGYVNLMDFIILKQPTEL